NHKNAPVSANDRLVLAEQVLHDAANPHSIDQGQQMTCNVTSLENRAYTRNPSEAARVVVDMATKGKYVTNGTPPLEVVVEQASLKPHGESRVNPPADGARSYSGQIFQVTAVNMHYQKVHSIGGGDVRYEQHEPNPSKKDNGERLIDYSDPRHPKVLRD